MFCKHTASGLLSICIVFFSAAISSPVLASVGKDPLRQLDKQTAAASLASDDTFPYPKELESNVAFWQQVYSSWDLDQVVLHDMQHMQLIYDVLTIPGEVKEGLTKEQSEWVRTQREALESRLSRISRLHDTPDLLSREEQELRNQIIKVAGIKAAGEAYENLRSQRGLKTRFYKGLEISGRYNHTFREIFRTAGLPEDLAYLPHVESSFQNHARSSVGAAGMWQFMRATGRYYMNVGKAVDERMDPVISARAAARYLASAYEVLDNWALALTSYNHGVGGMARARQQFGHDFGRIVKEYEGRTFGFASRNFYAQFLAAREIADDVTRFFPEGVRYESPLKLDFVVLDRPQNVVELAKRFQLSHDELAELNPAWNRAAIQNKAALPRGARVWLPAGMLAGDPQRNDMLAVLEEKEIGDEPPAKKSVSAKQRKEGIYHTVKKNESLSTIAKRYKMTVAQLREFNGLASSKVVLQIGQKLRVNGAKAKKVQAAERHLSDENKAMEDAVYHVVRTGDSPYLIASNYGVSLQTLLKSNQLTKRSILRPGQRLMIPTM